MKNKFCPTIIICSILTFTTCIRENPTITGEYIQVNNVTDTLDFDQWAPAISFEKGRVRKNGTYIDGNKYGPYDYKLEGDKMLLLSTLSHIRKFEPYEFKLSGDTLIVGNFYNSDLKGQMETFVKAQ